MSQDPLGHGECSDGGMFPASHRSTKSLARIACVFAFALAGCADKDWIKPGADQTAVSRDLEGCRGGALANAPAPNTVTERDRSVAATVGPTRPAGSSNERFITEHEDVRRCMVLKGYTLGPAR